MLIVKDCNSAEQFELGVVQVVLGNENSHSLNFVSSAFQERRVAQICKPRKNSRGLLDISRRLGHVAAVADHFVRRSVFAVVDSRPCSARLV